MKRALTIIELLVVTAIILILLAIIVPIYARAKDSANTAAMLAQQQQITMALRLYSEDYEGKHIDHDARPGEDWPSKLSSYIKSPETLNNPRYNGSGHDPRLGRGFALNTCLTFIQVVETDNPIWLFEAAPFNEPVMGHQMLVSNYFDAHAELLYPGATPMGGKWLADSRNGGSVISYWDGSAKWINFSTIPFRGTSCHLKPDEKGFFEVKWKVN